MRFAKDALALALILGLGLSAAVGVSVCVKKSEAVPAPTIVLKKEEAPQTPTLTKPGEPFCTLTIPGTDIKTDVFHANDPDDYLKKNRYGEVDLKGETFSLTTKKTDELLANPLSVFYGHNLHHDEGAFSQLWRYRDQTFFNEHPYAYIQGSNKTLAYKVVSAYVWDARSIEATVDTTDEASWRAYLTHVTHPDDPEAHVTEDATLDPKTKLLQLSTCVNTQNTKGERFIVTYRLLGEKD